MEGKIYRYIEQWKRKGYSIDIPDHVPHELMKLCLAPSYKSIAIAILSNDHSLRILGVDCKKSEWYNVLKKIELKNRGVKIEEDLQGRLF